MPGSSWGAKARPAPPLGQANTGSAPAPPRRAQALQPRGAPALHHTLGNRTLTALRGTGPGTAEAAGLGSGRLAPFLPCTGLAGHTRRAGAGLKLRRPLMACSPPRRRPPVSRRTLLLLQPFVAPGSWSLGSSRGAEVGSKGSREPEATLSGVVRCVAFCAFLKWVEKRTKISAE